MWMQEPGATGCSRCQIPEKIILICSIYIQIAGTCLKPYDDILISSFLHNDRIRASNCGHDSLGSALLSIKLVHCMSRFVE